jgi:hypothetical protein
LSFKFNHKVLSGMPRIKDICKNDHSKIKSDTFPWDVDLRNSSRRKREDREHLQNNVKTKPKKLKLSKTYPLTWS